MHADPDNLETALLDVQLGLRAQTERLQVLWEVNKLLASPWDLQKLFPRISATLRTVLRHEFASFVSHDLATGLLVRQALDFPQGKNLIAAMQVLTRSSPAGLAVEEQSPKSYSKEDLSNLDDEIARAFVSEGIETLCCAPLLRPKGPLGVLVVGSTRRSAFRDGDLKLLSQVAAQLAIAIENHRTALEVQQLRQRLGEERQYLEGNPPQRGIFSGIIGDSAALAKVLDQIDTVATSDAAVMILGETGTGKELVARAIHDSSHRKKGPFIKLNCAAIPLGLLESELFGHERGAFTGAITRKIGRLELADDGTLFLDEVGEIPMELQPKLLRVLQDHEFERLGSTTTRKVNMRLITATNRDLEERIESRQFRRDLFYRLKVFPIRVPALRERREDIPLLVRHFVHKVARRMQRNIELIPKETMKALMDWKWPGNIRELENLIERSVILSEGTVLRVPLEELRIAKSETEVADDQSLVNSEKLHIIRVLRETGGVLSGPNGAAKRLGLKRTTLQSKMERLGITREAYEGESKG